MQCFRLGGLRLKFGQDLPDIIQEKLPGLHQFQSSICKKNAVALADQELHAKLILQGLDGLA